MQLRPPLPEYFQLLVVEGVFAEVSAQHSLENVHHVTVLGYLG